MRSAAVNAALLNGLVCLAMAACNYSPPGRAAISQSPTATIAARATDTLPAAASSTSTFTPASTQTPDATPTTAAPTIDPQPTDAVCTADVCVYQGALFLQRPILSPGNDSPDLSYRFGTTQGGMRDPHHGVEFLNPYGTPVVAAAAGTVVVAGTDIDPTSTRGVWPITFYGPYSNFYGNLVVIEHNLPAELAAAFAGAAQPFYTLYGHLSEIEVQVGQAVQAGQPIGKVGQAGIATGSHLHFEVRIGENSYKASRNPEAWLRAKPGAAISGAVAGSFIDSFGNRLEIDSIVLEHLPGGPEGGAAAAVDFTVSVSTYEEKSINGLPPLYDSFAVGDLPPGWYRLSFPMGGLREELVEVFPTAVTVIVFRPR